MTGPDAFSLSDYAISLNTESSTTAVRNSIVSHIPLLAPREVSDAHSRASFASTTHPYVCTSSVSTGVYTGLSTIIRATCSTFALYMQVVPSVSSEWSESSDVV